MLSDRTSLLVVISLSTRAHKGWFLSTRLYLRSPTTNIFLAYQCTTIFSQNSDLGISYGDGDKID